MWMSPIVPLVVYMLGGLLSWKPYGVSVDMEKRSAYECGFASFGSVRSSFSIYFFLFAIFFLIFDVELVVLMPLPFMLSTHVYTKFSVFSFIVALIFGLYHEWREGSIDWPD